MTTNHVPKDINKKMKKQTDINGLTIKKGFFCELHVDENGELQCIFDETPIRGDATHRITNIDYDEKIVTFEQISKEH